MKTGSAPPMLRCMPCPALSSRCTPGLPHGGQPRLRYAGNFPELSTAQGGTHGKVQTGRRDDERGHPRPRRDRVCNRAKAARRRARSLRSGHCFAGTHCRALWSHHARNAAVRSSPGCGAHSTTMKRRSESSARTGCAIPDRNTKFFRSDDGSRCTLCLQHMRRVQRREEVRSFQPHTRRYPSAAPVVHALNPTLRLFIAEQVRNLGRTTKVVDDFAVGVHCRRTKHDV